MAGGAKIFGQSIEGTSIACLRPRISLPGDRTSRTQLISRGGFQEPPLPDLAGEGLDRGLPSAVISSLARAGLWGPGS
jgi:hypothetical protein